MFDAYSPAVLFLFYPGGMMAECKRLLILRNRLPAFLLTSCYAARSTRLGPSTSAREHPSHGGLLSGAA